MCNEIRFEKLNNKIIEVFGTHRAFAKAIGMASSTLSRKLAGNREWKICEIKKCVSVLGIEPTEIAEYFFN